MCENEFSSFGTVPLSAEKSSWSNWSLDCMLCAEATSSLCNLVDMGSCTPNVTECHGSETACVVPINGVLIRLHA